MGDEVYLSGDYNKQIITQLYFFVAVYYVLKNRITGFSRKQ